MKFFVAAAEVEREEEQLGGGATMVEGGVTQAEGEATTQKAGNTQLEGGATTEEGGVIQSEGGAMELEGVVILTSEEEPTGEAPVSEEDHPAEVQQDAIPPEFTTGNDVIKHELLATSVMKRRAQRSRVQGVGAMRADENLLSQEMFVSIEGNQFRRNAMGSFGTFLY